MLTTSAENHTQIMQTAQNVQPEIMKRMTLAFVVGAAQSLRITDEEDFATQGDRLLRRLETEDPRTIFKSNVESRARHAFHSSTVFGG